MKPVIGAKSAASPTAVTQGKKTSKVKKPQPGASGQPAKGGKVAQPKKGGGAAKGGAAKGGKGATGAAASKEREEGERESSPELYDPEDPTQEGGDTEGEDELVPWSKAKKYIDQVRAEERYERDRLSRKLAEHLEYMKEKLAVEAATPHFKNAYNTKHYERTQSYVAMLVDAKYDLEIKAYSDCHTNISACLEALGLYKKQIKIADKSPFGWETVERLGGKTDEAEVKKVEAQLAEEKAKKKKNEENSTSSSGGGERRGSGQQNQQSADGGVNPRKFKGGPCLWCHAAGHQIATCRILQEDYANGDAAYDPNTAKYYRVRRTDKKERRRSRSRDRSERR